MNEFPNFSGPPLHPTRGGFCALTGYGLIRLGGTEAAAFLQGQATCDVSALPIGRSGPGALCTPKGRVIASFRLLRGERSLYLLLSSDLAETVVKRLQIYVLRSKVLVEDLTPRRRMTGLFVGATESAQSAPSGPELPTEPGSWLEQPDQLALCLNDGTERYLIAAETDAAQRLWTHLQGRRAPLDPAVWWLKEIEAAFPVVTSAVTGEFLPQMLNLDALGGIGFKKGCYTGQEIVTRTHYLGQVKRRMFRLLGFTDEAPAAGALLFDADAPEPQPIGQVVLSARESPTHCQFLAVIALVHARRGNIRLHRPDGPRTEFLPLPYPLEST